MLDPSYYGTMSEFQWFLLYDHHIRRTTELMKSDALIAPYLAMREMDTLRDMERQALLAELRRVNCQTKTNSSSSTVLAATP